MEIDYEKEYKEALERAKHLRDSKYQTMNAKRVAEEIFPVLAESEDERMRKAALKGIEYLERDCGWDVIGDIDILDVKEYLEKQKDLDKMIVVSPEVWDNAIADAYENGKKDGEKQKEQKPPIAGNDFGWIDELKHDLEHPEELDEKVQEVLKKRQKPVERGLEDDHIIGFVYDLLNEIEWKDNWAMSKEECLQRLNNYSPKKPAEFADDVVEEAEEYTSKVDCGEYGVEVTEAYIAGVLSERNRGTEWSEEDEKMLNEIITLMDGGKVTSGTYLSEYVVWLKSLRPSWKPSEEQMDALDKALYYVPEEIGIPIAEIYGHFNKIKKKLM